MSIPVSRVLSGMVIYLGLLSPAGSSDLPTDRDGQPPFLILLGLAPDGVYIAN